MELWLFQRNANKLMQPSRKLKRRGIRLNSNETSKTPCQPKPELSPKASTQQENVHHPRLLPEKNLLEIEETTELFEFELSLFCLLGGSDEKPLSDLAREGPWSRWPYRRRSWGDNCDIST
jgi:hypothetical protein